MDKWKGKVAVVTGSTRGIGDAIAKSLVNAGLKVVGLDIVKNKDKWMNEQKGHFFPLLVDVTEEEEVLQAFKWIEEELGPVHILINNAATKKSINLINGSTTEFRETIDLNVIALSVMTRETIKSMRSNDVDGHIIHLNSISGHVIIPIADLNIYAASKHAVTALTETLRLELNAINCKTKVTSISPCYVQTELYQELRINNPEFVARMPLLNPDDVADAVLYILSTPSHVQVHELILSAV